MKRPCMWICLTFLGLVALIRGLVSPPAYSLKETDGQKVCLTARIERVENKNGKQIIYLNDVSFQGESAHVISQYKQLNCICYPFDYVEVRIGQTVRIEGVVTDFAPATNPGSFDAQKYYEARGYSFQIQNAIILEKGSDYSVLREAIRQCRDHCARVLDAVLLEDAGIMKAMLLGDKSSLDAEIKGLYQKNGISHILAISGLHISFLGVLVTGILRSCRLPLWLQAVGSIVIMILYGEMVGMGSATFRAIFLFSFHLLARILRRSYDVLTTLALAAVLLVLEEPSVIFDAAFLLSFIAVAGISLFYPIWKETTEKYRYTESFQASFMVTLAILPITLYSYFEIPITSVLLNLLVLPLMSILVGSGLAVILIGSFSLKLAAIPVNLCHGVLWIYEKCCEIGSSLLWGRWIIGQPAIWQILLFYLLFLGTTLYCYQVKRSMWLKEKISTKERRAETMRMLQSEKKRLLMIRLVVIVLLVGILAVPGNKGLKITFLDVGQGDGICIENGRKEVYLIDCGSSSKGSLAQYVILPFLKSSGITQIDIWFITHSDIDHCGGIKEYLQNNLQKEIPIHLLVLPIGAKQSAADIIELAKQNKIPVQFMQSGDTVEATEMELFCLHPSKQTVTEDVNASSLVLGLQKDDFSAAFMADSALVAEEAVEKQWDCELTLLKLAHHGSAVNSNSESFLLQMSPQISVISCGEGNRYGHPHAETMERLSQIPSEVLRTDYQGAVIVSICEEEVYFKTYCEE